MQDKYSVRSVLDDPVQETEAAAGIRQRRTPLEQAKKWALDYLRRPHSEKELRDRLREKGAAGPDIETVCALCIDYGFVDDREYAGTIVRHYTAMGYGAGRIRQELYRRGIPETLRNKALEQIPDSTDTIDRLLARRLSGRDASDKKERERAAAALFRRGFSREEIRAALSRYGCDDECEY